MIKDWINFNEGWFSKKEDESNDLTPKGFKSSTVRPTDVDIAKGQQDIERLKSHVLSKVDPSFLQEISDRLYGPDSESYIEALKELNLKFRKREGRYGNQLYDPYFQQRSSEEEKKINQLIKRDNL